MASYICMIEHWVQLGSGITAGIAAAFWLWASLIKFPHPIKWETLNVFSAAAVKQSGLNAWAATFAAAAAFLQMISAFMPTCWSGSPFFIG